MNNESTPHDTVEPELLNDEVERLAFLERSRSILKRISETEIDDAASTEES